MSSLLAYGQGFLAEDIGSGAGLTEPWAQTFGLGDGEEDDGGDDSPAVGVEGGSNLSLNADPIEAAAGVGVRGGAGRAGVGAGASGHGHAHHHGGGGGSGHRSATDFFSLIQACAPALKAPGDGGSLAPDARAFPPGSASSTTTTNTTTTRTTTTTSFAATFSVKSHLHWDSPPQSPGSSFLHLPSALLSIIVNGTKADLVVVGVFRDDGAKSIVEALLILPRALSCVDYIDFKPDLVKCVSGKMIATEGLELPVEFTKALGERPQAFLAHSFSVRKYDAIIYGLWKDASQVTPTAEGVFSDAVKSLPTLLSNRLNARKYERLGRQFDAILKVMPDAVLFVDDECGQVVLNPAAATLLGLPNHGEVEPSKVAVAMRALTDRCSTRTDPQHWMRWLSDEQLEIEEDWELKMPRRVLHVRSFPVTSHAARGRFWIYEDVTCRRDVELAIEDATKAKSRFLAMMSHELRTPMTGVLGMLDLLHLTDLEEEQQDLVKIMQESAEGLMDVINNILDYCKIEAGRVQLEQIDCSLNDLFEGIQTMSKTSFLKKELNVTFSGDPSGRSVVRGDPVRLRQIIMNLVSNAIKFTEDGSVSVSWRFLDPEWEDMTEAAATSQSSSGESRLIDQIINRSRGETCCVEHSTTPSGRSVIVVNCSSGLRPSSSSSAAAPASSHLQQRFLHPRFLRDQSHHRQQQPLMMMEHCPSSFKDHQLSEKSSCSCSKLPSVPVSCSLPLEAQPPWPPAAHLSQSGEARNSFLQPKNIAPAVIDPLKEPKFSNTLHQQQHPFRRTQTHLEEDPTPPPFTQKPLIVDPSSSADDYGLMRSPKYPKLSPENAPWNQRGEIASLGAAADSSSSLHVPEEKGFQSLSQLNLHLPHWRAHLDAYGQAISTPVQSTIVSVPFGEAGSSSSRVGATTNIMSGQNITDEQHEWRQRLSGGGGRPLRSDASSMANNGSEKSGKPSTPMDTAAGEAKQKESSCGPKQFSEVHDRALLGESKLDEEGKTSQFKQEARVWLEVTVSDTGVGIGKDQLGRLFVGPQAGSQRLNAAGTGLGLAICKGLLCLMNGKIQFDSKIGEGTTVVVTVPLLAAAAEEDGQDLVEPSPTPEMKPGSMPRSICPLAPDSSSSRSPAAAAPSFGEVISRPLAAAAAASPSPSPSPSVNDASGLRPMQWASTPIGSNRRERTTCAVAAAAAAAEQIAAPAVDIERNPSRKQLFITEKALVPSAAAAFERKGKQQQQTENLVVNTNDEATVSKGRKGQVLVAEDNKVNQLLIRKMLIRYGHEVEVVGNGKLAVEAVQRSVFDLVLMDVQMPVLDGLSATKAIRSLPPPVSRIPIYALSADALGSGPVAETGVDGYLKKPIDWNEMAALIAKILAAKTE